MGEQGIIRKKHAYAQKHTLSLTHTHTHTHSHTHTDTHTHRHIHTVGSNVAIHLHCFGPQHITSCSISSRPPQCVSACIGPAKAHSYSSGRVMYDGPAAT